MPKSASTKKKQPTSGNLTMRQATALRLAMLLPGLEVDQNFGHACYATEDGKIFCFINRNGDLAMKLPMERIEVLVNGGDAVPLQMGKRTMREWVVVPVSESPETLSLVREAKTWVESLPPEPSRRRKTTTRKAAKKS